LNWNSNRNLNDKVNLPNVTPCLGPDIKSLKGIRSQG
jgi:hypothetical protein